MTIKVNLGAVAEATGATALAQATAKESSLSAVITRADGTVENIGVIAYWHVNPLKRWLVQSWITLKRTFLKR